LIDLDVVMGVLDGGDTKAAAHELGYQPLDQRCFPRVLPAGNAEHGASCHGAIRSAWA